MGGIWCYVHSWTLEWQTSKLLRPWYNWINQVHLISSTWVLLTLVISMEGVKVYSSFLQDCIVLNHIKALTSTSSSFCFCLVLLTEGSQSDRIQGEEASQGHGGLGQVHSADDAKQQGCYFSSSYLFKSTIPVQREFGQLWDYFFQLLVEIQVSSTYFHQVQILNFF